MKKSICLTLSLLSLMQAKDTCNHDDVAKIIGHTHFDTAYPIPAMKDTCMIPLRGMNAFINTRSETVTFGEMFKHGESVSQKIIEEKITYKVDPQKIIDTAIWNKKPCDKVILITDPDCPVCKTVQVWIKDHGYADKIGYIFMPLRNLHPESEQKILSYLSQKDPISAYHNDTPRGEISIAAQEQLKKMEALTKELYINGTPTFILIKDGKIKEIIKGPNVSKIATFSEGSK